MCHTEVGTKLIQASTRRISSRTNASTPHGTDPQKSEGTQANISRAVLIHTDFKGVRE